ncbi:cysteine desulfurase family protein [Sphingomonas koreensis]|nr:cysteine desulfurase family protein [Sphingomonas koreensis]
MGPAGDNRQHVIFQRYEGIRLIYLDHQASTTMHPAAIAATADAMACHVANPHSSEHAAGWGAADAVDAARGEVAKALCVDGDEIVFVSGATEADNLALLGCGIAPAPGGQRVIVSALEHKAVLGPSRELQRRGFEVVVAPVTTAGVVDLDALSTLIDSRTLLVSIMLVNNEIGTVQPVGEVARLCSATGALLHVDAAQALGWMPIDAHELGADMMSVSGHKMGGPKGVGALFVRREIRQRLAPLMFGGEQEDGLRPGTLPVPLCVGLGAACGELPDAEEVGHWRARTARLEAALLDKHSGAWINGSGAERHPGCISITLPGLDAERLVARLQPGLAVSRGSACASGIPEPSHVLRAIGLSAADCDATVRISTGRFTTDFEIDEAMAALGEAIEAIRTDKHV